MTPRKKLAQLQRESKPSKFGNKPVYACPFCWHKLEEDHNFYSCVNKWKCIHARKSITIDKEYIEIFDSLAEHTRGLELKPLETAGVITDLEHHKKFKLAPKAYYFNDGPFFKMFQSDEKNGIEIPHRYRQWESDYTYIMKGEKVVEEVKRLGTKEVTRTLTDAITKKSYKQKCKIPYPHFIDPESEFRKICQLMLAIHGHRVQVRAKGQLWMFNAEWELERIHGMPK